MHRSIRIAALALPLALAMTWGAGAASATMPFQPDADVPWAPFEQPEVEPDGPAAPVPWAPFEWDPAEPEPDPLPEAQPEPESLPEPDPGIVEEVVPEVVPAIDVTDATPKQAPAAEDATQLRDTGSMATVALITGLALAGLALCAGILAIVLARSRKAEWR